MSDQSDYEKTKMAWEQNIRAAERAHDRNNKIEDMFNENADRHVQAVIRIILALNGGAIVGLLAFIGSLFARSSTISAHLALIDCNFKWFIFGLILSTIAAMMAYATNFAYTVSAYFQSNIWDHPYVIETATGKRWKLIGWGFHLFGVICALAGLVTFMYWTYEVQHAIANLL